MSKRRLPTSMIPVYFLVILCLLGVTAVGSRVISVYSQSRDISNRSCVIIDAGHGGVDGGATSCTGVLESKINLDIAKKLEDIMHLIGLKTLMIRSTDRSIHTQGDSIAEIKVSDLKNRVKIANSTPNAILVSIHQNHFSDSRYSGIQVFYSETDGSKALAGDLQQAFARTISRDNHRQIKKADGVYLMKKIECTGILVECGFISNPEEEAKLRDEEYQRKLCSVLAVTICNYLDRNKIH